MVCRLYEPPTERTIAKDSPTVMIEEIEAAWAQRGRRHVGEAVPVEFSLSVLRELAKGTPVTPARAAELDDQYTESDVAELFRSAAQRGLELDDKDALIGNALTLSPARHRIRVGDNDLFAWCSLDTLFLPALHGATAEVSSTDPVTGTEFDSPWHPKGSSTTPQPPHGSRLSYPAIPPAATLALPPGQPR